MNSEQGDSHMANIRTVPNDAFEVFIKSVTNNGKQIVLDQDTSNFLTQRCFKVQSLNAKEEIVLSFYDDLNNAVATALYNNFNGAESVTLDIVSYKTGGSSSSAVFETVTITGPSVIVMPMNFSWHPPQDTAEEDRNRHINLVIYNIQEYKSSREFTNNKV